MKLTSTAFKHGGTIPQKYGRDFKNINPPLTIQDVPAGAVSLVLIMEDPDVPKTTGVPVWDHWIVFNIPPATIEICEAWNPTGICGIGTRRELSYGGPRPPDREHRYFFKLFALDIVLELKKGSNKQQMLDAMECHVIDSAKLMGRFASSENK